MQMPSTEFLTQQAILNIGSFYWGSNFRKVLDLVTFGGDFCPPWLKDAVSVEIELIERRYQ